MLGVILYFKLPNMALVAKKLLRGRLRAEIREYGNIETWLVIKGLGKEVPQ
jgi:hypothetical protein